MTTADRQQGTPSTLDWPMPTPVHWSVNRIKWSVSGLIGGTWGNEPNGIDDLICVRVADFDRNRYTVVDAPPTLRAIEAKERGRRLLRPGDLLIEKSGGGDNQPVGCVVEFSHTFAAVCSNFIGRLPIATGMWPRYWTYVHATLYSGHFNVPAIKQTTGIQNLDTEAYFNLRVPYPPTCEQRAIASYLDRETARLDAMVAAKERVLGLLAEKRRGLITRAVTRGLDSHVPLSESGLPWLGEIPAHWKLVPLRFLVDIFGGATPNTGKPELWDGDIPWVSPKDMKKEEITDTEDHVSLEALKGSALRLIDPIVVLIVVRGMILVHSFPTATTTRQVTINQDMKALRCRPSLAPHFLRNFFWGLESHLVSLVDSAAHGTRKMETEALGRLEVCVPPIEEQLAIVKYIDDSNARLDQLRGATERTINLLKERRAALIAAAVTGQINLEAMT
ncbi:type I restriction endonuclease subunit S [Geothrix rubra]|uniref:Type I restriction endonuclease subunit S n=1 Tax=Geothrix rubra TaxID=2927977 RepID=A0ABQ5Q908_9BACT|nr:restriction endonuclease subunit S [Geothrix rubra]GLH71320.1 type I restriction endonuclease subunit S [Geothrix rubra]